MPSMTFDSTFTLASNVLLAGLDGGYFLTSVFGTPGTVHLRHLSNPTASLDSINLGTLGYVDNQPSACVHNNQGDVYLLLKLTTFGIDRDIVRVTQSGGTLSLTTVGTFTTPVGSSVFISMTRLSADGTELGIVTAVTGHTTWRTVHNVNTSTAAVTYSYDLHAAGYDSYELVGLPGSGRFLTVAPSAPTFRLFDSGGSLSTLTGTCPSGVAWVPVGSDRLMYAYHTFGSGSTDVNIATIDCTSGTLSYAVAATTVTTGWDVSDTSFITYLAAWGSDAVITASTSDGTVPYTTESFYVIDSTTGTATASDANTYAGAGVATTYTGPDYAGATYFVTEPFYGTDWTIWTFPAVALTRKILRLIQSPRSNPTRVGQTPILRARQKFV